MATTYPGYNPERKTSSPAQFAGTRNSSDPTNQPGQYPPGGWEKALFGGALPDGTGAPGTQGATGAADDATNEPGQTEDGLTGISEEQITDTGAPGSAGADASLDLGGGQDSVQFTKAGSFLSGTYDMETVTDDVTGPADWTQANDSGYGTGGPQLPGAAGNEPQAGKGRFQPGGGKVMRGGRAVRP